MHPGERSTLRCKDGGRVRARLSHGAAAMRRLIAGPGHAPGAHTNAGESPDIPGIVAIIVTVSVWLGAELSRRIVPLPARRLLATFAGGLGLLLAKRMAVREVRSFQE